LSLNEDYLEELVCVITVSILGRFHKRTFLVALPETTLPQLATIVT